jgi:LmbE family N-acetylglucosaminyl deacetylase
LIWEQVQRGLRVEIWTIFASDPPEGELSAFAQSLHTRWGNASEAAHLRREEDAVACETLGAAHRHFSYPDCIYRHQPDSGEAVIQGEDDLFRPSYQGENLLVEHLCAELQAALPANTLVVAPFGVGRHIDHQVVHSAVLKSGRLAWYYTDYPYAAEPSPELDTWQHQAGASYLLPVSEHALQRWQMAIAAYRSQISTFWQELDQMQAAMHAYWQRGGGSLLRRFR